jgi:putative phosphoesterase
MMKLAEQMLENVDELQANTRAVLGNVRILFDKADTLASLVDPSEEEEIRRILIVSDLHSNPVGIEVMRSITRNFDIDYLVNAGDMSDYGSSIEMKLAEVLNSIPNPTVFAPGNHDTPEVNSFMEDLPNTRVLDGQTVPLGDLQVLGNPDPLADDPEVDYIDINKEETELQAQIDDLTATVEQEGKPDIIVLHNPKYAEQLADLAPVIICGHTHRLSIKKVGQSVFLNPGSIGAAGVRGVYSETGVPYSAIILYMQAGETPVAADQILYHPASGRFSIERSLLGTGY